MRSNCVAYAKHLNFIGSKDFQTHLFFSRYCRCAMRVSRSTRHMLNCLISRGQDTVMMQVYRHWDLPIGATELTVEHPQYHLLKQPQTQLWTCTSPVTNDHLNGVYAHKAMV